MPKTTAKNRRYRLDDDTVVVLKKHSQFLPLKGLRDVVTVAKPRGAFDISKSTVQVLKHADILLVQTKPQQDMRV